MHTHALHTHVRVQCTGVHCYKKDLYNYFFITVHTRALHTHVCVHTCLHHVNIVIRSCWHVTVHRNTLLTEIFRIYTISVWKISQTILDKIFGTNLNFHELSFSTPLPPIYNVDKDENGCGSMCAKHSSSKFKTTL